jgi:hypothetical protein
LQSESDARGGFNNTESLPGNPATISVKLYRIRPEALRPTLSDGLPLFANFNLMGKIILSHYRIAKKISTHEYYP